MKKAAIILTMFIMLLLVFGFSSATAAEDFKVLILHDGSSTTYLDTWQHFSQSLITDLAVSETTPSKLSDLNLKDYSLIYLDSSLAASAEFKKHQRDLMDYTRSGGSLFLENPLYDAFPKEFIGASGFRKISSYPQDIQYPKVKYNLQNLQDLVKDFDSNYEKFKDFDTLRKLDYGYGILPSTAESLVNWGDISLYALNRVDKGYVFLSSPLLPNTFFVNSFDLTSKSSTLNYFNPTAATANFLFKNEFAAFVEKESKGYVLKKVMGIYGRPAMAWQNHFEALTGIRDNSMVKFTELMKKYQEIPSFSLVRSSYDWGVWKETVRYQLNTGTTSAPRYVGEEANSQYSSGRPALIGDNYLAQQTYPMSRSLAWSIDLPYKASPVVADLDGDGSPDMVSGSADGYLYFYKSKGKSENWQLSSQSKLQYEDHTVIQLGSYTSPVLYDYNQDGLKDLIVGNDSGTVSLLLNEGNMLFARPAILLQKATGVTDVSVDIGDIDGDRIDDLVLGDAKGELFYAKGSLSNRTLKFRNLLPLKDSAGKAQQIDRFIAPRLYDFDGDGKKDLVVGTNEGFIKKLRNQYPAFEDAGYVDGDTLNQFGNHHIWTGHNAVPCYIDVNGDGKEDLVTGQLEFGMAVPIDSAAFPYKAQLKQQLQYAKENFLPIIPHFFTHNYKSTAQEQKELELHKQAFAYYGLPWAQTGVNQHTSRVNVLNPVQTFLSEKSEGLWWNSGFKPANSPADIGVGTECAMNIPFLLSNGKSTEDMILFSASTVIAQAAAAYDGIARADLPVSYFRHIEYDILNTTGIKDLNKTAGFLDQFRDTNDYNFMREDQMFDCFLSTMQTTIQTSRSPGEDLLNSLQNKVRTKQSDTFYVEAANNTDLIKDTGIYKNTAGVKLEVGEKYLNRTFHVDSDVYMRKGHDLYFSLEKKVRVTIDSAKDQAHIVRVNVPITLSGTAKYRKVNFLDSGLQQIKIYAPSGIIVGNKGWTATNQGGYTTLTRYGDKTTLNYQYK